jgi:hypothetical protein
MGVPVTKRALIQRINRKLEVTKGRDSIAARVKATRGGRAQTDLGDYYLLDAERGAVLDHHLDLEAYGRELGVLAAWERLES